MQIFVTRRDDQGSIFVIETELGPVITVVKLKGIIQGDWKPATVSWPTTRPQETESARDFAEGLLAGVELAEKLDKDPDYLPDVANP